MGREIRKVPATWEHPRDCRGYYIPLMYTYDPSDGNREEAYMPNWPEHQRTHFMMYEDTSEGTPLTPAFKTLEEVAQYLVSHGESVFGSQTASYEEWLRICHKGSSGIVVTMC